MSQRAPALTSGFIAELDGLRGIAILMVMVHRFWPRTGIGVGADVAGAGWIGVDLFFVISGFLITGILLDTKGEPGYFRNFYARRMLRIFPLYYLFVVGVLLAFSGNPEFRDHAGSPFWYLFHLGNIPEGILGKDVPYFLAPTWSLAIEEQFYLTFPLLVWFLNRQRLTLLLVGMIAFAPVIRMITTFEFPEHERVQYLFTLCRIDTLAVGCLLAILVRSIDVEKWRVPLQFAAMMALPSIIILAVASGLERTSPFDRVFGYSIVAVGCACIVAIVVLSRGSRSLALLRLPPLQYFGKLCFGLYLLHRPADTLVRAVAARVGIQRDLWLLVPKICVALALATISWQLFEKRFLRLKDWFVTDRHPNAAAATTLPAKAPTGFIGKLLRTIGILSVLVAMGCDPEPVPEDAPMTTGSGSDGGAHDAAQRDAQTGPFTGRVLYPEGSRHSPITPDVVAKLQAIAAFGSQNDRVFAKVGDSITVEDDFLNCFDGGTIDLAGRADLSATVTYFMGGNAAGSSPFARTSYAARGGTTAADVMNGSPSPLVKELTAITPRIEVLMFGTNEDRYGWSLDAFGEQLWDVVDASIARGVIPVMSTIPANTGYPAADARVPTFNRVVRAIAQGRGVPLVDLHRALEPLPNRGISSDGIHPSIAPSGGCILNATGLQYGYNMRNLLTLEVLARTRDALAGVAADASAPQQTGEGTASDPFVGGLPFVDLRDTRAGSNAAPQGCGAATGNQVAFRITVPAPTTIDANVIDRPGTDVDVRVIQNGTCLATGDASATAAVAAGHVDIVVEAQSGATEGEFLLVVESR
ncbi:MAG: acyltransferase family protein [Kofleriaceae bacterium]|nr:acyltransferase family protein [Kofleriaceae bacterium]